MWPYVLLIMIPLFVQHLKFNNGIKLCISASNSRRNIRSMKIFWLILFMLLILRHETVGIDTEVYAYIYEQISDMSWLDAINRSAEIGYSFMNKLVSMFALDFRWILIISAYLSVGFVARGYIRYSLDATLTISIFIILSNFLLLFSGLRQAIAISIGFWTFECVRNKNKGLFITSVILAMLFHTSAFMLLVMYPLYHLRVEKWHLFGIIPVLSVLLVFNKEIFGVLSIILMRYTKYDATISSTGAVTMLILFILFLIFSFLIPEESELDNDTVGMRNFLLFSVALQMFASLHTLAMRMNYYYIIFIPLLIPRIINCRSIKWKQVGTIARYVMIVFFMVYFFVTAPVDNVLNTFPYRFLWEHV